MRWPRVRLWMLLVLVILAAVALGAAKLSRRAARFRAVSEIQARREATWKLSVQTLSREIDRRKNARAPLIPVFRDQLRREALHIDYHAAPKRKYDRAARHPWLSVAPDPPEPE